MGTGGGFFDPRKKWVIVRPASCAKAAALLAEAIAQLRAAAAGLAPPPPPDLPPPEAWPPPAAWPPQIDSNAPSPEDDIIIINCDEGSKKTSFSWRAAESRIEIYGHALSSVDDAVSALLEALNFRAADGRLVPPAPDASGRYPLSRQSAYRAVL